MMKINVFIVAFALSEVAHGVEAEKAGKSTKSKRTPIAPSDILSGTGELLYDAYARAHEKVNGLATQYGVHKAIKEHSEKILPADPIEVACSKLGCKKKELMEKYQQVQGTVLQAKAQAYEHAAKAHEFLNGHAHSFGSHLETKAPEYAGHIPKNIVDLVLMGLYVLFVSYMILKIAWFGTSTTLSIFCCVCCCGCCRRKKQAGTAKTNSKNGKKDSKADQKGQPATKAQPKKPATKK
jgi:hypothetical protein